MEDETTPPKKLRKKIIIIILLSILIFHSVNNLIFLGIDARPSSWDSSLHKSISISYYNKLMGKGETNPGNISSMFNRAERYPKLYHISTVPLYILFGLKEDVAEMINLVYLVILVISVYLIGKELYSEKVGLLAAFITSIYPIVFGLTRLYLIDIPLTAITALFFYFLIKLKREPKTKYIILTLISILLGIFLKQSFLVFIFAPLLYVIGYHSMKLIKKYNIKRRYIIIGTIALAWLMLRTILLYLSTSSGYGYLHEITTKFSLYKLTTNLPKIFLNFINIQTSFVLALTFIFSLAFFKKIKERIIFLLWIAFPILFMAATGIFSGGRYLTPILPAVAIISSFGIFSINHKKTRKLLMIFIIIFSLFHFFDISYSYTHREAQLPILNQIDLYQNKYGIVVDDIFNPKKGDWQMGAILDFIYKDSEGNPATIEVTLDSRNMNEHNFAYESYRKGYPFHITAGVDPLKADYVVMKTGYNEGWRKRSVLTTTYTVYQNMDSFESIKWFLLPDKSFAQVIKRK